MFLVSVAAVLDKSKNTGIMRIGQNKLRHKIDSRVNFAVGNQGRVKSCYHILNTH